MFNNPFGLISYFLDKRAALLRLIFVLGLLFTISACSKTSGGLGLPTPEDGKANVIGQIQNTKGEPYVQYTLRLAEVYWQNDTGAYVMDESFSPGDITGEDGDFQIFNAAAGEYVVVLGGPNMEYKAITDADGILKRITINAGETFELGTIVFDY